MRLITLRRTGWDGSRWMAVVDFRGELRGATARGRLTAIWAALRTPGGQVTAR